MNFDEQDGLVKLRSREWSRWRCCPSARVIRRTALDQFLIECTCLGINAQGTVYAPYGLGDMEAGRLKRNALNHSPGLYAAKAASYLARWPWLLDTEQVSPGEQQGAGPRR
ncbi:nucleotidyltransferase family protein [Deinococcus wulumuqiensis]|uniref:nucleotidyltransferase family protein n=1 Tax=Deinococcus wulumuqiensis TaxID=980427 RepID=UPI0024322099|nr:nucleotidyltransferase family protein [Deinococcus wulumuqiensis]